MEVHTRQQPARDAGIALSRTMRAAEAPVLLLCSGGSALKLLSFVDPAVLGPHVTMTVLDERYTSEPEESNFAQLATTDFSARACEAGAEHIDTRVQDGETCQQLAERFAAAIAQWRTEHPQGQMVATVGIGEDGHTAGIVPMPAAPEAFAGQFDGSTLVMSYHDERMDPPDRVTATLPLLRALDASIGYAVGDAKRPALERVTAERGTVHETPARILREQYNVQVFTDVPLHH